MSPTIVLDADDSDTNDEPLLSGFGDVSKECTGSELDSWSQVLQGLFNFYKNGKYFFLASKSYKNIKKYLKVLLAVIDPNAICLFFINLAYIFQNGTAIIQKRILKFCQC